MAFIAAMRIPRKQLVFQLTSDALPLLRHCTGWRKEWLFSLNVSGVQVSGEYEISVQELKISQLRLQEDKMRELTDALNTQIDKNRFGIEFSLYLWNFLSHLRL